MSPTSALLLAALLALAPSGAGAAAQRGVVFVDRDGDGALDAGEPGLAGVVVSNGETLVRTDADGRYALPARDGFISVTCPAGYDCAPRYLEGGGAFALRPRAAHSEFFFIQVSDAHVYDRKSDFQEFSSPAIPWFIPQVLADWLTLRALRGSYGRNDPSQPAAAFREALAPYVAPDELADMSDFALFRAYRAEFARDETPLGDVLGEERAAFAEVAALRPEFVIQTGDLVLESNRGSADAIERWFRFYRELSDGMGVPVYETIGNNEIAGIENPAFPPEDPRYAKYFFRKNFGPTHYSFDRGAFHFVALDTHRPAPKPDRPKGWSFGDMTDVVRDWADRDLALHEDRVLVVLNHEPFHIDPAWGFENPYKANDAGLFRKHRVRYVLTGHTHLNSFMPVDGVTNITTGALSGLRWVLPPGLHPRGYRLFWARGRDLYSAWKPLDRPMIRATEPNAAHESVVVVAAADARGPFVSLAATHAGQPLVLERWGDCFARIALPPTVAAGAELSVVGTRADGSRFEAAVAVP